MSSNIEIPIGKMIDWKRLSPSTSSDSLSALEAITFPEEWKFRTSSDALRNAIMRVFDGKCGYQNAPLPPSFCIDHIVPRVCLPSDEGSMSPLDNLANYIPTSHELNRAKGSLIDVNGLPSLLYMIRILYAPKVFEQIAQFRETPRSKRVARKDTEVKPKHFVYNTLPSYAGRSLAESDKSMAWLSAVATRSFRHEDGEFFKFSLPILEIESNLVSQKREYAIDITGDPMTREIIQMTIIGLNYQKIVDHFLSISEGKIDQSEKIKYIGNLVVEEVASRLPKNMSIDVARYTVKSRYYNGDVVKFVLVFKTSSKTLFSSEFYIRTKVSNLTESDDELIQMVSKPNAIKPDYSSWTLGINNVIYSLMLDRIVR